MERKSPSIEAIAFTVRSIVIVNCKIGMHDFNPCTVYVDLHAVCLRDTCGFGRNSIAVLHPFIAGAWHGQAKSIMNVCKPELLCGSKRCYGVEKLVVLHFNRITARFTAIARVIYHFKNADSRSAVQPLVRRRQGNQPASQRHSRAFQQAKCTRSADQL